MADVAAKLLTDTTVTGIVGVGQEPPITGTELAEGFARHLGRKVTYESITPEAFGEMLAPLFGAAAAAGVVAGYKARAHVAADAIAGHTSAQRLLGLKPRSAQQWLAELCYASFAGRMVGEPVTEWGNYLYVKKNAVELARKEVSAMPEHKRQGTMLLSSVTDPYQGAERKYRLTRGILQVLVDAQYPGKVRILTKSPIVTRDVDLLTRLPQVDVGMTVTTTDDRVSRWLEVRALLASRRLRALAELRDAGIPTFAFVGPLLPHFVATPGLLDSLLGQLADAGVREIYMEHINLKRYIRERMNPVLAEELPDVQEAYVRARTKEHRAELDAIVKPLLVKHGLRLRFEEVIYHDDFKKLPVVASPSDRAR